MQKVFLLSAPPPDVRETRGDNKKNDGRAGRCRRRKDERLMAVALIVFFLSLNGHDRRHGGEIKGSGRRVRLLHLRVRPQLLSQDAPVHEGAIFAQHYRQRTGQCVLLSAGQSQDG